MNMKKRLGALSLALVMTLSALTGCGGGGSSSSGSASGTPDGSSSQPETMDLAGVTDPYLATAGIAGDSVVAKIGTVEITAAELLYWLNYNTEVYLSQFGGYFPQLPWETDLGDGTTMADEMKQGSLEAAAYYAILPTVAEKEGLSVEPSTVEQLESTLARLEEQMGSPELVDHYLWHQMATRAFLTELEQRADLHLQLQDLYYGENSADYPTDAEVLAYAQDELGAFRVKHILLMAVDQATQEPLEESAVAEKKATADNLLAQLRAAEDPVTLFDQLMNEYSEDTGLIANPDGYLFTASDSLVGGFREASLALEVGQISDVVETDYGYHIILRLPIDPAEYRSQVVAQRMQAKADQWMQVYGLETTELFAQIDPAAFRDKVTALQRTVQSELQDALSAQSGADSTDGSQTK